MALSLPLAEEMAKYSFMMSDKAYKSLLEILCLLRKSFKGAQGEAHFNQEEVDLNFRFHK